MLRGTKVAAFWKGKRDIWGAVGGREHQKDIHEGLSPSKLRFFLGLSLSSFLPLSLVLTLSLSVVEEKLSSHHYNSLQICTGGLPRTVMVLVKSQTVGTKTISKAFASSFSPCCVGPYYYFIYFIFFGSHERQRLNQQNTQAQMYFGFSTILQVFPQGLVWEKGKKEFLCGKSTKKICYILQV